MKVASNSQHSELGLRHSPCRIVMLLFIRMAAASFILFNRAKWYLTWFAPIRLIRFTASQNDYN